MMNKEGFDPRPEPTKIFMVKPTYFDVVDVKNVYMEGSAGTIDKDLAFKQWKNLLDIYTGLESRKLLEEVTVLEGQVELHDMVFCANQSFSHITNNGELKVVMSNMKHNARQKEVRHIEQFYKDKNYEILTLPNHLVFEGTGDCIKMPYRNMAFLGHGYRTSPRVADELSKLLQIEILPLKLINPNFYHLDTCFIPLSNEAVVLCESAFSSDALKKIADCFEFIYFISESDAINNFSLNAHCMDFGNEKIAIVPIGSNEMKNILTKLEYEIFEIDTSEFIKAGGSVFCMKMMYY